MRSAPKWRAFIPTSRQIIHNKTKKSLNGISRNLVRPGLYKDKNIANISPGTLLHNEQVAIFSNASIVIGAHGAGLSNIIFAPAGTP